MAELTPEMPRERPPLPTPPLAVIPATGLGVQAGQNVEGTPIVMLALSNAVFHCNFPMELQQAEQLIEDTRRAILEARGLAVPGPKTLHRP